MLTTTDVIVYFLCWWQGRRLDTRTLQRDQERLGWRNPNHNSAARHNGRDYHHGPPMVPSGQNELCITRSQGPWPDLPLVVIFPGLKIWAIYLTKKALWFFDKKPALMRPWFENIKIWCLIMLTWPNYQCECSSLAWMQSIGVPEA